MLSLHLYVDVSYHSISNLTCRYRESGSDFKVLRIEPGTGNGNSVRGLGMDKAASHRQAVGKQ